jgi:hypothetical protein
MAAISGTRRAGASTALAILLAACGPPKGVAPGTVPAVAQPQALPPRPLAEVFVLEASGAQPEDTMLSVASGTPRVVVVRRSAPDYGIFAKLQFPEKTLTASAGDTLASVGATIVFSYGTHFVAPAGARQRYGSNLAFEKELAIARLEENGQVVFLPTSRPGSDILSAPLSGPGRYLVAAPR